MCNNYPDIYTVRPTCIRDIKSGNTLLLSILRLEILLLALKAGINEDIIVQHIYQNFIMRK